jgi:hypothetical protein
MADSSAAVPAVPPGWYDDGTGRMRWWSGVEWTEHLASPYAAARPERPALPSDRPVYNVWIWLIVLLPLLSFGAFFFWQPNFDYLGEFSSPSSIGSAYSAMFSSVFTPGYFVIVALGLVSYGLIAVFAWRDVVWLRAQGVVRPFSWPWAFIPGYGGLIYTIGRSVIVYRVAKPRGRAPIWVMIAVFVLGLLISMIWTFMLMSTMFSNLPIYDGQYS